MKAKPEKQTKTFMVASTQEESTLVTPSNSSQPPTKKPNVCKMCDKTHFMADCKAFKNMTFEKRNNFCEEKGMFLNGGH